MGKILQSESSFTVQVLESCEARLDLRKLETLPNLTSELALITAKIGIDLFKDVKNGTLWIAGEWFQIAVTKSYLMQRYAAQTGFLRLKCPALQNDSLVKIMEWTRLDELLWMDHEDLAMCIFALCRNIHLIYDIGGIVFEEKHDGSIYMHWKLHGKPTVTLNKLESEFQVLELSDNLPLDYLNILIEVIDLKFQPDLTLTDKSKMRTYFVFPKQEMHRVQEFIETYKRYNSPSAECGIQYWKDIAHERKQNPLVGILGEDSAVGQATQSSATDAVETEYALPTSEKVVFRKQNKLHMRYFCMNYLDEIKDLAKQFGGTVHYTISSDVDQLEIHSKDSENQTKLFKYIGELYQNNSIVTKPLAVDQLRKLSGVSEPVLISHGKDASTVTVTGSMSNVGKLVSHSQTSRSMAEAEQEQQAPEVISMKGKYVRRHRDRKLLENGDDDNHDPPVAPRRLKSQGSVEKLPDSVTTYQAEQSGTQINIGIGDITRLNVSAIVNAANADLKHVGGKDIHNEKLDQ